MGARAAAADVTGVTAPAPRTAGDAKPIPGKAETVAAVAVAAGAAVKTGVVGTPGEGFAAAAATAVPVLREPVGGLKLIASFLS